MTTRCIVVALQRAGAGDRLEHLVDGASDKLTEIRRKLARWAKDVTDLPMVDRPPALSNRLGDNWFTICRIAKLAGEAWAKRAMDAALTPAMTADTNTTLALLDAIWRAFNETKRPRMHTADLLSELLDMDEGRWREARHGQPITAYYLRDNLGDMVPANAEEIAPRRWREGSGNPQFGYDVSHLKEAFERYLGKGLPGQKQSDAQNDPKTSDTSDPSDTTQDKEDFSDTSKVSDVVPDARVGSAAQPQTRRRAKRKKHSLDPTQASDPVSDTEKTEENEAT